MRTRQLVRDLIRKIPNAERQYINDRGTLITLAVKAHHDGLRDARVKLAEANLARLAPERRMDGLSYPDLAGHSAATKELAAAKRTVAGRCHRGEICVVRVSPVNMPRVWPNALPGGTSRRRAERVSLRAQAKASGYVWYERDIPLVK